MSAAIPVANNDVRSKRGALILAGAMLVCMPLVAIQGPGHTTPMDAVNVLFMAVSWLVIFARKERVAFPLGASFWVIMVASFFSLYTAIWIDRSAVTILTDLYLFFWFVTLTHFLDRNCDTGAVGMLWTGVSCLVALLTLADEHFGVLGGLFSGARRATGTFENPNMFGDYLVVSFFVAWATAAGRRPFVYLALPLLFVGIRATESNGALVSLIGGCCAWFAATSTFWTRRMLGILFVAAGLVLWGVGIYHEEIEQFVVDVGSAGRGEVGGAAMKGASERLPIWKTIAGQVIATPMGVGPGNFAGVDAMTTGDDHGAHNEYLGMLAERGFLGLAGWLGLMATLFVMLFRIRAASFAGFRPFGPEALFGLFGAMCAHSLVIELSHFRHTWMVFALIASTALQAARVRPAPVDALADPPASRDPAPPALERRSA